MDVLHGRMWPQRRLLLAPHVQVFIDKEVQESTVFVSFKQKRPAMSTPKQLLEHFEVSLPAASTAHALAGMQASTAHTLAGMQASTAHTLHAVAGVCLSWPPFR